MRFLKYYHTKMSM